MTTKEKRNYLQPPPTRVRPLEPMIEADGAAGADEADGADEAGDKSYMQYCQNKGSAGYSYMRKKWCRKIDANRQWHGLTPLVSWGKLVRGLYIYIYINTYKHHYTAMWISRHPKLFCSAMKIMVWSLVATDILLVASPKIFEKKNRPPPPTFPSIPKCSESEASAAKILGISMEDPQ